MSQDLDKKILSDLTIYAKYARYLPEQKRRETWDEIVDRNIEMHSKKFPNLALEIREVYERSVRPRKLLPSARSLQFAGRAIEVNPCRIFNCAFAPIDDPAIFGEASFLLLGGTGLGFSVQKHHVDKLPKILGPKRPEGKKRKKRFLVSDCIEGWSDAFKVLVDSYFFNKPELDFDFSEIRKKGTRLVTAGGKAPGPEPLRKALTQVITIFENAIQERGEGCKLRPIEAHDMVCVIADAVRSGGIRRSALISLFDNDDVDMLTCKHGEWSIRHPHRALANNSAVMPYSEIDRDSFMRVWKAIENSGSGEPGISWTNEREWGFNPCHEISLKPFQFCNLTEINGAIIETQEDFDQVAKDGAFIGTLQASYTDFHYLRPIWRETTEEDALIGVGITGVASPHILRLNEAKSAKEAVAENVRIAGIIGINPAKRVTTIKPAGTTSLIFSCSSGIHAWHNDFYIRRITLGKDESLSKFMMMFHPELVEQSEYDVREIKIAVPQKAPEGAMLRTENVIETLERVKRFNLNWVRQGHVEGENFNNVSTTISVKDDEWPTVGEWMWENRYDYHGIAVLPYMGGSYKQAPFEDITKEQYLDRVNSLISVDLTTIVEEDDETDLTGEVACGGGACEVK